MRKLRKSVRKTWKSGFKLHLKLWGTIGNLVSSIYDGQIQKIEEEREANEEKYDEILNE